MASQVSFNYSGQKSDAGGYAQVYIDSKVGEPVATINLPVTGGTGTLMITLGGIVVMGGAVLLYARNRKCRSNAK